MNVAIIGSGIGGLCSAIRLASKGYKVFVFEKNSRPGGKIAELQKKAYRFDTGPSLFTLPHLLEELFNENGRKLDNYMKYKLLETNCRYFFADGCVFNFFHDKNKLKLEIENKTIERFENLNKRLRNSAEMYKISSPVFIFNDFHKLSNYTKPEFKNILFKLHRLEFWKTMHTSNKELFRDPKIIQIFDRYATYNGSSPYKAPSTLNMIAHLENNIGAFFPEKGIYQIVDSLYKLALENNVKFKFDSKVTKIVVEKREVKGIIVEGEYLAFDLVVSDCDVKYLSKNLINHPKRKSLNRATPSSSALIFYWGIRKEFKELDIHNILFSTNYKKEFECIFKKKTITDDPTVYIFISSKEVKEDAPIGCENWFVMINVPSDNGQDWEKLIKEARSNIINKINTILNTNIEQYIELEEIGSPRTIEQATLSDGGALYGSASNSMLSAFKRHPNTISNLRNLYFVGGSVHPGGGIPLCIASSDIVCKSIKSIV